MTSSKQVADFFAAYQKYAVRAFGLNSVSGTPVCGQGDFEAEFFIQEGGATRELLNSVLEDTGLYQEYASHGMEQLLKVWTSFTFCSLSTPLVSIFGNAPKIFDTELVPAISDLAAFELLAFGRTEGGTPTFCLDLSPRRSTFDQIVLVQPGQQFGTIDVSGPVFDGGAKFLEVSTLLMEEPAMDSIEVPPSDRQVSFLEDLKSIDPVGFGGLGWSKFWSRWFFGER